MPAALSAVLAIACVLILPVGGGAAAMADEGSYSASTTGGQPLVVVVDLSSSMLEDDGAGTVRLDGAKKALVDVVRAQPAGQQLALWTYPAAGDSCSQGGWAAGTDPRRPADPSRLTAEIRALQANGDTPTGPALRAVADDLAAQGLPGATVLLVSDGESNCGVPACTVAEEIVDEGFDLSVLAMGFQISEAGRSELQCIATATEGAYYDVDDSAALAEKLDEAAVAQLRLDVDASRVVPARSALTVDVTVTNPTARDANGVQVALAFVDAGSRSMFPAVVPPRMRLGTIPAGQSVSRHWRVSTGGETFGTAAWRVTAWSEESGVVAVAGSTTVTQETLGLSDAGPVLADALASGPLVILGDSYSSGEGAGDYLPQHSLASTGCHRSSATYGVRLVGEDAASIIACSGAVVGDFFSPNDGRDVPAQLTALADIAEAPGAVALTVGGNDINFGGVVRACVMFGDCSADEELRRTVFTDIAELGTSLENTYRAVDRIANSARHVADRGGRTAPIVVLPYIQVLPEWQRASCSGFTAQEVRFGNEIVTALDQAVRSSVDTAAASGVPVYSADPVHEAVLPNHTACSQEPYVNDVTLLTGAGRIAGDWVADRATGVDPKTSQELLHPNAAGYSAITNALVTWSQQVTPRPAPAEPAADAPAPAVASASSPSSSITLSGTATTTIAVEAGSAVEITVTGVAPGFPVRIVVRSAPQAIGSLTADADGLARGVVYVPAGLAPGRHTLVASGFDPSGAVFERVQPLSVRPATPWWYLPAVGGVAVVLLAGLGLVVARRRADLAVPRISRSRHHDQGREFR